VKDFFAAMGRGDRQGLLALSAEDIEWIIPGEDWPLAGTHRGHAELADVLQKASEKLENSYPEPPEFVAQGDRVLVVDFARGKVKDTNTMFEVAENIGGKGGTRTLDPGIMSAVL
jgi:ketosteroid isomerase-like protein